MLELQTFIYEPRHKSDHVALVSPYDFQTLCGDREVDPDYDYIFVALSNQETNEQAYARVEVSNDVPLGAIGIDEYIAHNCSVGREETVLVRFWDVKLEAVAAKTIKVREINSRESFIPQNTLQNLQERLTDSMLTLRVGHRFLSVTAYGEILAFEVTESEPKDMPVICSADTQLLVENFKVIDSSPTTEDTTFADVGGLKEAKRRLSELVILPARYPEVFRQLGIKPSKGILLNGPPGSGKTLLARTIASSFGASFFFINGPELFSKWYGESEARLREVFAKAHEAAPSVIFIDELDAIAPQRERVSGSLEIRMVSQLLTLMDGIQERGQIVIIGATNRVSAIDPALRRPGRFDSEIEILPPNEMEREEILVIHTKSTKLAQDVELQQLAQQTVGFVGADLALLCQEAALSAIRRTFYFDQNKGFVQQSDRVQVSADDFNNALRIVQPSAFRTLEQPEVTIEWGDIIGFDGIKQNLVELIEWPLTRREALQRFGVRTGQCISLMGAPQSGKTVLAVSLAKKLNLSLIYIKSGDLLIQNLGQSEQAIRDAFRRARLTAPSLIFIDNFEQLLSAYGSDLAMRIMGQIQQELALLRNTAHLSVVVATRSNHQHIALVEQNPVFDHIVKIPELTHDQIRDILSNKLGSHISNSAKFSSLLPILERSVKTIGQLVQLCEKTAYAALQESSQAMRIELRHLEAAIERRIDKIQ